VDLVDSCIARIEALNPEINAVVAKDYERARESARAADAAREDGTDLGALHGLPMTIKDSLETAGLVTTSGAPELRDHVPREDAVAVHRAVHAGAIVLGKTNLPMYASDWQTFNAVYGRTNNPWDFSRTVGGSSGGSAASIAAGFVPLDLGSDIAGSIRTPASHCGVYGHKPSHGVVPGRGHIPGPPGSKSEPDLAVVGPLARTAADLRLALDVIAGPDVMSRDGWSLELPPPRAEQLKDFRVGYWLDDPLCPIDSTVRIELEATIEALRPYVELIDIGNAFQLEEIVALYTRLLLGVIGTDMPKPLKVMSRLLLPHYALAERLGIDSDVTTKNAVRGLHLSHADWNRANEGRTRLRWQCHELFHDIDVLLTPVSPITAFPHQTNGNHLTRTILVDGKKRPYVDHIPWIALATSAFLPATSAPIGLTQDGLPVNVQIIGPYLGDKTTIRFAELLADVMGGFRPPP
jgi:amidase